MGTAWKLNDFFSDPFQPYFVDLNDVTLALTDADAVDVGDDDVVEDDLLYLVSDHCERKLIGEVSPPSSHVLASIPASKMAVMAMMMMELLWWLVNNDDRMCVWYVLPSLSFQ